VQGVFFARGEVLNGGDVSVGGGSVGIEFEFGDFGFKVDVLADIKVINIVAEVLDEIR
jgi:hypothetical protein